MECGVEREMFNVEAESVENRIELAGRSVLWQAATSPSSAFATPNGTKHHSNLTRRAPVPMRKTAIAITKMSHILRLARKMACHTRHIFTKCCANALEQ